jgi:hypothetical protein
MARRSPQRKPRLAEEGEESTNTALVGQMMPFRAWGRGWIGTSDDSVAMSYECTGV